jgi:GDPmannose 4,6-dehydratase
MTSEDVTPGFSFHQLTGDYSKGKKILGWEPRVSFRELIQMMVDADLTALSAKIR